MKKNPWLLVALLALFGLRASLATAQPTFNAKLFGLMNGQRNNGAKVHMGASRQEVTKVLGKSTKQKRLADEIAGGYYEEVYYRANKLYFKDNKLESFELHDNTLVYGQSPETAYHIGAKIAPLEKFSSKAVSSGANYLLNGKPLVQFEVDAKPGKSRNVHYSLVALSYPKYGNTIPDASALELLFDANNKLIMLALSEDND